MNNNSRITQSIQQSIAVKQAMLDDNDFLSRIERAAQIITESLRSGGKIHFCGNGGSAADAQHLAAEHQIQADFRKLMDFWKSIYKRKE